MHRTNEFGLAAHWAYKQRGARPDGQVGWLRDLIEIVEKARGSVAYKATLAFVRASQAKRDAEAEGLHEVVRAAGGEWREPGCSMCIGMNGDTVPSGKLSVSTSNRNFEGRQGSGARTVLASPVTAAAAAIKGAIVDPRECPDRAAM